MRRAVVACILVSLAFACRERPARGPVAAATSLPPAGVKFEVLPDGEGKAIAETRCLPCHSSEMIRQQRLTEAQWKASLEKMVRWGSDLRDHERPVLLAYVVRNFGPANRYTPIETLPIDLQ